MQSKRLFQLLIVLAIVALTATVTAQDFSDGVVVAGDDGVLFRRDISKTPDGETEDAAIKMMNFYVPVQSSDGTLTDTIAYYGDPSDEDGDPVLLFERSMAKPLVAVYIDGIEDLRAGTRGGIGFGHRDTFIAYSLDDGATWKRGNVSDAADLSSFTLKDGTEYPGDSYSATFAVSGNKVLAAWLSRYCMGGTPAYALTVDDGDPLTDDETNVYPDYFGVTGSQKSVDYTSEYPDIGEIPYGCVWTARGTLEEIEQLNDEGTPTGDFIYEVVWRKAERLTSGRRDANRIEAAASAEAGFVIAWQEDPDGLRPGQGLGPGEGWSGAIVNAKTDIWYTVIDWDDFDYVQAIDTEGEPIYDEDGKPTAISLEEYLAEGGETMPKVGVPMTVPIRLTDNNKCLVSGGSGVEILPYCYLDMSTLFTENPPEIPADDLIPSLPDANATYCAEQTSWTTPGGQAQEICVSQDGRVMLGRVGSSRPRIALHGYDTDGDGTNDSAWVVMAYEETKALGEGTLEDEEALAIDVGKNIWYHSFDMFKPDIISHGNMLNQPAKDPLTGDFFEIHNTAEVVDLGSYNYDFYETEIARRFSLISQSASAAGDSGTVAFPLIKQGVFNQGGPADIFARRIVLPEGFDAQVDNPYAFENMVCDEWAFNDGSHPYYPGGVCLDDPINLSGTEIVACDGDYCPVPIPDEIEGDFPRVTEWIQTPEMLGTQSWHNPYDISKGHRGFLDGDFIMMMYAWSPNWKMNSVGNDHYNLYVRRSFDGGVTWTTTPTELGGSGTTTCENYGWGGDDDSLQTVCTAYGAGAFEQARNVSQLIGNRETVLDPRYAPTSASIEQEEGGFLYPDDERDRTKFFVVYETGDNTTVAVGEATPLDLFYSRATVYGDMYDVVEFERDTADGVELEYRWDWLEHDKDILSGEASVLSNPGGTFFYNVWNQWQEDEHEEAFDSDAWFRRILYLDDGTDGMPVARIVSQSHTHATWDAGTITFVGSAEDNDHTGAGIVAYEWTSSLDGLLDTEQICAVDVVTLSEGTHTITFAATDDEGNTATATTELRVGERPWQLMLPILFGTE